LPRQLIGVAATLDDERLIDEPDRGVTRDAQPQVVVLAHRQVLVETSDAFE